MCYDKQWKSRVALPQASGLQQCLMQRTPRVMSVCWHSPDAYIGGHGHRKPVREREYEGGSRDGRQTQNREKENARQTCILRTSLVSFLRSCHLVFETRSLIALGIIGQARLAVREPQGFSLFQLGGTGSIPASEKTKNKTKTKQINKTIGSGDPSQVSMPA